MEEDFQDERFYVRVPNDFSKLSEEEKQEFAMKSAEMILRNYQSDLWTWNSRFEKE